MTPGALIKAAMACAAGDAGGGLRARTRAWLCQRYNARDVVLTDSGTSALRLALAAAVADTPGPVALPAFNCFDIATAVVGAGVRVLLYDLDPATLEPDPDSVASVCAQGPSAVVGAHLYGYPVDICQLREASGQALVIEDAAQAAGGSLRGTPLGASGSLSVLSFGRGKGMTGGGGGALLAHDERGESALRRVAEALGDGGRGVRAVVGLSAQMLLGRPSIYGLPAAMPWLHLGETVYKAPHEPRGAPVASLAALGAVVRVSDEEVAIRRRNAGRLTRAADAGARASRVRPLDGAEPGFLRFPVVAQHPGRDRLLTAAIRRLGACAGYPIALDRLEALAGSLPGARARLPGARLLASQLVTLPTHRLLTESDLGGLEAWLSAR